MELTATKQLYVRLQQVEFRYQIGELNIIEFIEAKKIVFSQSEEIFKHQIIETAMNCFCEGKYSAEHKEEKISSKELIKYAEEYFEKFYYAK